jgi:putative heme-binding domain-containing protein
MWVEEQMFETFTTEQPQWVYPPASHVARGPSGVTYLTGETLPPNLRNKFLLANYRGASVGCTLLTVGIETKGAGYVANSEDVLVEGVGVSDVELGYDGNLYLCDFGGGWNVNTNGAIHVVSSKNEALRSEGAKMAERFAAGLADQPLEDLTALLQSPDKRMRQLAQFELVHRGKDGQQTLLSVASNPSLPVLPRLHAIWAFDQIGRQGGEVADALIALTEDPEEEVRANAARTLGSLRLKASRDPIQQMLTDDSARVRSLAAIALSRVADQGDASAIDALFSMARATGSGEIDPVLRHACLTGLYRLGTADAAVSQLAAESEEVRLMATLFLRSTASADLAKCLDDASPVIRHEAIRAIYDTDAVDGPAGDALASLEAGLADLPMTLQRRVVAANYRKGGDANARRLVKLAGHAKLDPSVRAAAFHALRLWEKRIETDPVLGHYRPLPEGARTMVNLGVTIESDLKDLLLSDLPPEFSALGLQLADETGVELEEASLGKLAAETALDSSVRIAALNSLVSSGSAAATSSVASLIDDGNPDVAATAMNHGFALKLDGIADKAHAAIESGPIALARAGIKGLATAEATAITEYWQNRETAKIREALWLDLYLALQTSSDAAGQALAATFVSEDPGAVHALSETGGDPTRGESVFRNQGACLQCHKVGNEGGVQGPALTKVGDRLQPDKLVESLVNPNAEIAEGYGMSTVTLSDGSVTMGRIAKQTRKELKIIGLDGTLTQLNPDKVATITPPMSAMPPMGLSLPPADLRDLVAYLTNRTTANAKAAAAAKKDDSSHGEEGEEGEDVAR